MGEVTKKPETRESTEESIRAALFEHYASGSSLISILEREDTFSQTTFYCVKAISLMWSRS